MVCRFIVDQTDRGKGAGVLGRGSFGLVYKVSDAQGRQYALKTSEEDLCDNPMVSAAEFDIHMRLDHPNLLSGIDVFRHEDVDGCGVPLTAVQQGVLLPLVDGDLGRATHERNTLPTRYVNLNMLYVAWQLACGLEALHVGGYAHFDLKPQNIMLKGDHVYLADFGLSFATAMPALERQMVFTINNRPPYVKNASIQNNVPVLVQAHYMAADLYALGLIYLHLTMGRYEVPFKDPTEREATHIKHRKEQIRAQYEIDQDAVGYREAAEDLNKRTRKLRVASELAEDRYVMQVAQEENASVDALLTALAQAEGSDSQIRAMQREFRLPFTTVDGFSGFFRIIKDMISMVPTELTARQVRERLETLFPTHPVPPRLMMRQNLPTAEKYRDAVTAWVQQHQPFPGIPRAHLHLIEFILVVLMIARPYSGMVDVNGRQEQQGLVLLDVPGGTYTWVLAYLLCCCDMVGTFYGAVGYSSRYVPRPLPPQLAALTDPDTHPLENPEEPLCLARSIIMSSKEIGGKFNVVLLHEPYEYVPATGSVVLNELPATEAAFLTPTHRTGDRSKSGAYPTPVSMANERRRPVTAAPQTFEEYMQASSDDSITPSPPPQPVPAVRVGQMRTGVRPAELAGRVTDVSRVPLARGAPAGTATARRTLPPVVQAYNAFKAKRWPILLQQYPEGEAQRRLSVEWQSFLKQNPLNV